MFLCFSAEACEPAISIMRSIRKNTVEKLSFITKKDVGLEKIENYGSEFLDIIVVPICITQEFIDSGFFKERVLAKRKTKEADLRLRMNYEKFISSPPDVQRLMYIENIVRSIRALQKKSKVDFRGEELIRDILNALDVKEEQLEEI